MRTHTPLALLASLGVLCLALPASAAVDTSQWKCETCPYPKGLSGAVEAGLGSVSDASRAFGDMTGLERDRAHLVLGGTLTQRSGNGYYADLSGTDLGLDTRELSARAGREGLYSLRLGYSQLPRHFGDGALTPFLGQGSTLLTLPAGFPAASTSTMPLATTLGSADLGFDRKRFDLDGTLIGGSQWTYRFSLRRETRDGTRPLSVSFFSTAAQLSAPVDQVTDQFELSASYSSANLQASLAYVISQFRNDASALRWDNPFLPVVAGATRGQLAQAPDSEFHQLVGSAGYAILPWLRVSGDFAVGRMTQNAAFLPSTITTSVAGGVAALPAASLDGRVDTFNASVKLSATPLPNLRLSALYARDVRENDTGIRSWPQVATDIFYSSTTRSNTPFSFWRDRVKLDADWRGPATLRLAAGVEQDNRERSYQEVVETRETTVWGRAAVQPVEMLSLALKVSGAERKHSSYGVSTWFGAPENLLLRKYQLAERRRDSASARADLTLSENLSLGLTAEYADDDYRRSLVGLQSARSSSAGLDLAFAFSERSRATLFVQSERIRSRQAGSQLVGAPDWFASSDDRFEVAGIGFRHTAIPDKLDLGVDLTSSRSRSTIAVTTVLEEPPFPTDKTTLDSVKLFATYKVSDKLSLTGSWWHEQYRSQDWRLDGILPATLQNLLLFGQQAPRYRVNVVRLSLRYGF